MNQELARRIAVTIGALLLLRLGTYIPVPGLVTSNIPLTGGAVLRISPFALGLVPYLTAAIFIQLLSMVWRGPADQDQQRRVPDTRHRGAVDIPAAARSCRRHPRWQSP